MREYWEYFHEFAHYSYCGCDSFCSFHIVQHVCFKYVVKWYRNQVSHANMGSQLKVPLLCSLAWENEIRVGVNKCVWNGHSALYMHIMGAVQCPHSEQKWSQ